MTTYTSTDAQNKFGEVLESAQRGPVKIKRNGRSSAVIISVTEFEKLQKQIAEYYAWKETEYLNATPANRVALDKAINSNDFVGPFKSLKEVQAAAKEEIKKQS